MWRAVRELFRAAEEWAPRVGAMLAEIHPSLTVDDAGEQLAEFGYERVPLLRDPRFSELLFVVRPDATR